MHLHLHLHLHLHQVLRDLLQTLLMEKPEDPLEGMREYFKTC